MTESYLAQLEIQIERLLAYCDTLDEKNLALQNQYNSANDAEQ